MGQVFVTINGIILHCDDNFIELNLGNRYRLEKKYFDDISFENKITDDEGKLNIDYMGSQLRDEQGIYFICISKEENYEVMKPEIKLALPLKNSLLIRMFVYLILTRKELFISKDTI